MMSRKYFAKALKAVGAALCGPLLAAGVLASDISAKDLTPAEQNQKAEVIGSLERKIFDFSDIIYGEYKRGELTVDAVIEKDAKLNARYDSSKNNISVDCRPGFTGCKIDAVYHELAHHVYYSLGITTQVDFLLMMEQRLKEPDARDFAMAQARLNKDNKILKDFIDRTIVPFNACGRLLRDVSFGSDVYGLSAWYRVSEDKRAKLLERQKAYGSVFSSCTGDSYGRADGKFDELKVVFRKIVARNRALYDFDFVSADRLLGVESGFSFPLSHDYDDDLIESAGLAYFESVDDVLSDMESRRLDMDFYHFRSRLDDLSSQRTKMLFEDIKHSGVRFQVENEFYKGNHDGRDEELFAFAVDSLYHLHDGEFVTSPVRFRLTPKILGFLEDVEYKGVKIFAPKVAEYREKVLGMRPDPYIVEGLR